MKTVINNWVQGLKNDRQVGVMQKRFGLSGSPQSLAAIGRDMNITRERARQIEADALDALSDIEPSSDIRKLRSQAKDMISESHGLKAKESLEDAFESKGVHPVHLYLVLVTAPDINFYKQTPHLNDFYFLNNIDSNKVEQLYNELHRQTENKVFPRDDFTELLKERTKKHLGFYVHEKNVSEFVRVSKQLSENQLGEVGHSEHPRIQLKTLKWQIRSVLEREDGPLHFSDIHKKLKGEFHAGASLQSVHNELIRSEDFVLAGRGTFALKEAGFDGRTVKDILVEFLKKSGPQNTDACISYVSKRKLVKPETVLTTLYNGNHFVRVKEKQFDAK